MRAKDSSPREPRRARSAGFTLFELAVVVAVLGAVMGLVMATLASARRRLPAAAAAAESGAELALARARLASDIRGARLAATDGQVLTLTLPDGATVAWSALGGRLTRAFRPFDPAQGGEPVEPQAQGPEQGRRVAGGQVRAFRVPAPALRVAVSSRGTTTSYVEVGLASGKTGRTPLAAARTRVQEPSR